jgi:hypothetical protein
MFYFPRGIEWWFHDFFSINHLIFVVHSFFYIQTIFILAALFRYRYFLGQEEYLSDFYLIDGLVTSSFGSFILAVAASVGIHQVKTGLLHLKYSILGGQTTTRLLFSDDKT